MKNIWKNIKKDYGILSEEQKEEVLKYYHNPMSDEEFMKVLKQFE